MGILMLLFIVSCVEGVYQTNFMERGYIYRSWENTWLLMTGCWDSCYLVTLFAMMWLWRPTSRNAVQMKYEQLSPKETASTSQRGSITKLENELSNENWLEDNNDEESDFSQVSLLSLRNSIVHAESELASASTPESVAKSLFP